MVFDELFNIVNDYDDLCVVMLGNCMQDGEILFCVMMLYEYVLMFQLLNWFFEKGIFSWGSVKFEFYLFKFIVIGEINLLVLFFEFVLVFMSGLG